VVHDWQRPDARAVQAMADAAIANSGGSTAWSTTQPSAGDAFLRDGLRGWREILDVTSMVLYPAVKA